VRLIRAFLCVLVLFSVGSLPASSAIAPPSETEHASTKVSIAPHRAIYKLTLASVKNGSNVAGVSGQMMFKWADVCDGWTVEQHMKLHFDYAEGDGSDVTSTDVSWEAKDGSRYNFNVRHETDGKETEHYKGRATLDGDKGGKVVYEIPKGKTATLPAGTVFPSTHTDLIIQKAMGGEKLFTRGVFDGSDENGLDDVSAFIHAQQGHAEEAGLSPQLKNNPLLSPFSWPIRLAFFKTSTETGMPDYEMDMDLLPNGVVKKMMIDYGDFSVLGTLSEIEALPSSGC
jgi:EipB-like